MKSAFIHKENIIKIDGRKRTYDSYLQRAFCLSHSALTGKLAYSLNCQKLKLGLYF